MKATVAHRIYYAIDRARMLRHLLDGLVEHPRMFDRQALPGLCDALQDIERALEPLTEAVGMLPDEVDQLVLADYPECVHEADAADLQECAR